jgi:DNA-binding transcriptional LysR family regulator
MQNVNWEGIQYCIAVINEGSVSAAAKSLGVNHTTVSRRITALEEDLGVHIFDRSTAGWLLTPLGEAMLPAAMNMEEEFFNLKRAAMAEQSELKGRVRVTAVEGLFSNVLMGPLEEFSRLYPEIDLEILSSPAVVDLANHEADIAFRATNQPPPEAVGKKICDLAFAVYATPALVARWREGDKSVCSIALRDFGNETPLWVQKHFPDMRVRFGVNSLNVLHGMVAGGLGFAVLPCVLGDPDARLERVLDRDVQEVVGLWVLSHIDLRTTARIRIFRDFMLDAMTSLIPKMEGVSSE